MRVVNINNEDFDVYIGRGVCPKSGLPSKWANPYTSIKHKKTLALQVVGSKDEAINRYREYVENNPELMDCLKELDGKRIGCFCMKKDNPFPFPFPYICHGQVLVELRNKQKMLNLIKK